MQGTKMSYVVALDSGGSAQQLMGAAGVSGIPHAFVVDRAGIIRYHGHPAEPRFAAALQEVRGQSAMRRAGAGSTLVVRTHQHDKDSLSQPTARLHLQVCAEAPAAAGPGPAAELKREPRELPRITQTREELSALPVRELKQILLDRGIA
jgi:hypothetical protein